MVPFQYTVCDDSCSLPQTYYKLKRLGTEAQFTSPNSHLLHVTRVHLPYVKRKKTEAKKKKNEIEWKAVAY